MSSTANMAQVAETSSDTGDERSGDVMVADTTKPPDSTSIAEYTDSSDSDNSSNTAEGPTPLHSLLLKMKENSSGAFKDDQLSEAVKNSTDEEIKTSDGTGKTPLHIAARRGLVTAVKEILDKNIESLIGLEDNEQRQPLHHACLSGNSQIVKLLLQRGADIEAPMLDGDRPLHEACRVGAVKVVDLLLKWKPKSADPNIISEKGWFPLIIAVGHNHLEIVKRLLGEPNLSVNLFYKDDGITALNHAAALGYEAIFDALLEKRADVDLKDRDDWTPLFTATQHQNLGIMQKLLRPASDGRIRNLETPDKRGFSPLKAAYENGFTKGVESLLVAGAHLDARLVSGSTPLIEASRENHVEMVKALLHDKCINIDLTNRNGETALHVASQSDHCEVAELLLDHKIDINLKDGQGQRALHIAIREKNRDVAALLIRRNAKLDSNDKFCQDLLDQLIKNQGMDDITSRIVKHIAHTGSESLKEKTLLATIDDFARHEGAKILLSNIPSTLEGSKPHESRNWSAIEWATYRERPEILAQLLGSSPDNSETRQLVNSAVQLTYRHRGSLQQGDRVKKVQSNTATDRKSSTENNSKPKAADPKPRDPAADRHLIDFILGNVSIFLGKEDKKSIKLPLESDSSKLVSGLYRAAIVQMFKGEGKSVSPRMIETVKQVVYGKGPAEIIREAKKKLKDSMSKINNPVIKENLYDVDSTPGLVWIHLPITNITWMEDLFTKIMKEDEENEDEENEDEENEDEEKKASNRHHVSNYNHVRAFLRDSWVEVPNQTSLLRSMRPRFVETESPPGQGYNYNTRNQTGLQKHVPGHREEADEKTEANGKHGAPLASSAIYMPYLSFSTCCHNQEDDFERAKGSNTKHLKMGPPVCNSTTTKCGKARKRFQDLTRGRHIPFPQGFPTLDEWYYQFATAEDSISAPADGGNGPNKDQTVTRSSNQQDDIAESMGDRKQRNRTQVITKSLNPHGVETDHWRLLRVNQLWLWTLGNKWLITATNDPIDDSSDPLWEGVLEDINKLVNIGGSDFMPSTPKELSRLIVDHCIGFYEKRPKDVSNDKHFNDVAQEQRERFSIRQYFSNMVNKLGRQQTGLINDFVSQQTTADNTENKSNRSALTIRKMKKGSETAETLSYKIKDIRDELNILRSIAKHQVTVQNGLGKGSGDRKKGNLTAIHVVRDIEELEKVAERIESAIDTTRSLQQGQESVRQGRIFMIFTVVTILFAPLSFLSSLFALDVATMREAPGWAFAVIFGVSLIVSLPLAVYAYLEETKDLIFKVRGNPTKKDDPDRKNNSGLHFGSRSYTKEFLAKARTRDSYKDLEYGTE